MSKRKSLYFILFLSLTLTSGCYRKIVAAPVRHPALEGGPRHNIRKIMLMPVTFTVRQTSEEGKYMQLMPVESLDAIKQLEVHIKQQIKTRKFDITDLEGRVKLKNILADKAIPGNYTATELYEGEEYLLNRIQECHTELSVIGANIENNEREIGSSIINYYIRNEIKRLPPEITEADALLFVMGKGRFERAGESAVRLTKDVAKSCLCTALTLGFVIVLPQSQPRDYYDLTLFLVDTKDGKVLWENSGVWSGYDITEEFNIEASAEKILEDFL